ncbi:competence/damage-inducible protein A [Anaeromicropila populeti]|uniref:Putative competence-damage inducible protein n=1 Tax=Anaeromicropila populeti TaxID=37658 RepID=A0A1I6KGW7_9FIRM|nr:competence/damage-inducible protein A [Anaeromicropila populeti]SFR90298.1 nicotinamide-nucleotide amidase [Anaeromicropila populeti]
MNAEIISVGTEILMGNIVNTNATYLAQECAKLGLFVYHQVVVGDNEERLTQVMEQALSRSDVILLTGGLGPTEDDLTKEVAAKVAGKLLKRDERTKERIKSYFKARGVKEITQNNWKQAEIIEDAIVLDNDNGTAPGFIVETSDNKRIVLLPGPPMEMNPMFQEKVIPYLKKLQPDVLVTRMVKICGMGESAVETKIKDLIQQQTNPTIATYAKLGEVHLRVTASAKNEDAAKKLLKPVVKELKNRFDNKIYTTEEEVSLESCVLKLLVKNELSLVTAESCTGGLLAGSIVNVPGASEAFKEGFITYSNKAKRKFLDVNKSTLKKYGAVSEKTAKEMARGAAIGSDADISIAITGVAGPDGGTEEKPIGLVYIGCYIKEKTIVKEYRFNGSREKIRQQAVIAALDLLRRSILDEYGEK